MSNTEGTQNMDQSSVETDMFDELYDETLAPLFGDEVATQEVEEHTEELEEDNTPNLEEDADKVGDEEDDKTLTKEEDEDETLEGEATQEEESEEEGTTEYQKFTADELERNDTVVLTIDGEEKEVNFGELMDNYQTKQSQSNKGDKLAEQAKELEVAKGNLGIVANVNQQLLDEQDQKDRGVLQRMKEKVDKAYAEDDIDAGKFKHELDGAVTEYKRRKSERDGMMSKQFESVQMQQQEVFGKQVQNFHETISKHIPDWDEGVAKDTRDFALEIGLPEGIVDTLVDPVIVKIIDDYRRLKTSTSKGAIKRKKAPVKRTPTNKPVSTSTKTKAKIDATRKRIAKGKASDSDHQDVFDSLIDDMDIF